MKKSRFTDEQIAFCLRQVESGVAVEEACRELPWHMLGYTCLTATLGRGPRRSAHGLTGINSLTDFRRTIRRARCAVCCCR